MLVLASSEGKPAWRQAHPKAAPALGASAGCEWPGKGCTASGRESGAAAANPLPGRAETIPTELGESAQALAEAGRPQAQTPTPAPPRCCAALRWPRPGHTARLTGAATGQGRVRPGLLREPVRENQPTAAL